MKVDIVADMEVDMVAEMEVDMVTEMSVCLSVSGLFVHVVPDRDLINSAVVAGVAFREHPFILLDPTFGHCPDGLGHL